MEEKTLKIDRKMDEDDDNENVLQLVIFQLGGEEFAVDIMQVQEIIRMPETTRIPQAPEYVKGVINLRGKIIVVVSLDVKFNIEAKEVDENSRVIVVEVDDTILGMVVDSVSEVIRLPHSNVENAPDIITSKIKAEYIEGVGKLDERLLILLDLKKVLQESEMDQISNIKKNT
ncbi:chemotaxis protein CheW [Methanosalsum natronophilum]|uniref:chemotaxis protein CheW n=1 Tax=Methanosalsum natronophilum TaxID=768733 RepID=UPI002167A101|nr:chemotaxis protein CheW [Methanosalsum natronophilum]MCS3924552.1 purine-binding chemotaxis protein CheW [Methanosalsum natronophilum]